MKEATRILIFSLVAICIHPGRGGSALDLPEEHDALEAIRSEIAESVERLGSKVFQEREKATRRLMPAGHPAVRPVTEAASSKDLEAVSFTRPLVTDEGVKQLKKALPEIKDLPLAEAEIRCKIEANDVPLFLQSSGRAKGHLRV